MGIIITGTQVMGDFTVESTSTKPKQLRLRHNGGEPMIVEVVDGLFTIRKGDANGN